MASPFTRTYTERVPSHGAADATADHAVMVVPVDFAGSVSAVTFIPDADLTGADTDSATLGVVNKGTDGNGTTLVASKAFTLGVDALDFDETALTLQAAANLVVSANQVLAFRRTKVGSSGLATPAGLLKISIVADS